MFTEDLKAAIEDLKRQKNAVILAHYYQEPDIQDVADYVGDSLGLSQRAAEVEADIIVFAGVHFMAETAKILNPNKKVLLPDFDAGCSLADSCPPDEFRVFKEKYSDHAVITYVNCSAEIKAMSDIVCTSSNAVKIVESIPEDVPILFAPDKNLGRYVMSRTGRDMLLWNGSCIVHEAFSMEKLHRLREKYPEAELIAHPESEGPLLEIADYVGSTAGMIQYVQRSNNQQFIVATEAGILHKMQQIAPDKTLIPAPAYANNACSCSECKFMKMNTLEKLHDCLLNETPEIIIPLPILEKALIPIERMLNLSK